MVNVPAAKPGFGVRLRCTGTSFTRGSPDRVMTTSSPASARSSSLEKWVFASWTPNSAMPLR